MEDMIIDEFSSKNEDIQSGPKRLDIFQHLKLSLRNSEFNCKCPGAYPVYYCIPCKVSICEHCGLEDHKKHILINKDNYHMDQETVEKMFQPAETVLEKEELFIDYQSEKEKLVKNVEDVVEQLEEDIKKYKEAKLKEIDSMFENFQKNVNNIKQKIDSTKAQIKKYMDKHKNFFNIGGTQGNKNGDQGNTIFLINYDILNIVNQNSFQIEHTAKSLSGLVKLYKDDQIMNNNKTVEDVHNILFPSQTAEEKSDDFLPMNKFIDNCNKLAGDPYKEVGERIVKYNSQIDQFKKTVFTAVSKFGNFREIEKSISAYENTKQKGVDNLFSKRKPNTVAGKESLKLLVPQVAISKKEEVALNNPILEKYFAYLTIDLYGNYFKMATKELQSSHADLMIKVSDEDEVDYGKAIEGTNEIMIYEKKNAKMFKKALKLTKNPHGYTKFPIGCRSLLLGDKLYITGGKDETKEYPVVLIYDRKNDTLKRIMDMRVPRCYHTMIFNEVFDTIMIIGGENENSVEIFDPLTNRWQLLPSLIYPRANPFFFFDESRGMMYTMFGSEGKIMNNLYSEVIEYLDLTNVKEGWMRLDYNNKANLNLRSFLNVIPLNNDLMLIYGGVTARNSTRTVCVLNLSKKEVTKVDKNLLEALRVEAKKSRRLSSIISSMSLTSLNN